MAKFSKLARGSRGEKSAQIPSPDPDGEPISVIVRAINAIEEEAVLVAARARAVGQGVADPKIGDPIYDLSVMVETIAAAYFDAESTASDRQKFFDGGADQVREYGREAVAYIYELQQAWQDEVAPTIKSLSTHEVVEAFTKLGGEDETQARDFFYRLRPGLRWNCMRSLALLLANSPTPSSPSGGN